METKRICPLLCCLFLAQSLCASKVVTAAHGDWNNSSTWFNFQVPVAPDTILVKHYLTFSQSLVILAPTVLIVEQNGTLCGDYLLDVSCSAVLINYGHIYVNAAKIRDGRNYFEFYAKNSMIITGCSLPGYGQGYSNLAPNGVTLVWPPVLCKTTGTNWEGGGDPIGIAESFMGSGLSVSPTCLGEGSLQISSDMPVKIWLLDLSGSSIYEASGSATYNLNLSDYPKGIYVLKLHTHQKQFVQKIVKY
jgi:hypothetical protein